MGPDPGPSLYCSPTIPSHAYDIEVCLYAYILPLRRFYLPATPPSSRSHRKKYACAPFNETRFVWYPRAIDEEVSLSPVVKPTVVLPLSRRICAPRTKYPVKRESFPSFPFPIVSVPYVGPKVCCGGCSSRWRKTKSAYHHVPASFIRRLRREFRSYSNYEEFGELGLFDFVEDVPVPEPPPIPVKRKAKVKVVEIGAEGWCWYKLATYLFDGERLAELTADPDKKKTAQQVVEWLTDVPEEKELWIDLELDEDNDIHILSVRWAYFTAPPTDDEWSCAELRDYLLERIAEAEAGSEVLVGSGADQGHEEMSNPVDPSLLVGAGVQGVGQAIGNVFSSHLGWVPPFPDWRQPVNNPEHMPTIVPDQPPDHYTPILNWDYGDTPPLNAPPDGINPIDWGADSHVSAVAEAHGVEAVHSLINTAGSAVPSIPHPILQIPWFDDVPQWVLHGLDLIHAGGYTIFDIVHSLYANVMVPMPFIMPALRIYQWFTRQPGAVHHGRWHYFGEVDGRLPPGPLEDHALDNIAQIGANLYAAEEDCVRSGPDTWFEEYRRATVQFTDSDTLGKEIAKRVERDFKRHLRAQQRSPEVHINSNVPDHRFKQLVEALPGFRVHKCNNDHPHSVAQAVRNVIMSKMQKRATANNVARVHGVGLTPQQAFRFSNVVHNCAPLLSGRDYYRQNYGCSPAMRQAFERVSNHPDMNNAPHKYQDCCIGTHPDLVLAPFVQDISVKDFVSQMIKTKAHTGWVVLNLPVPLLDERVKCYRDPLNGFRYERRNGKIDMYFEDAASGGYSNDEDALLSWCRPAHQFRGYQVLIEEQWRFGSTYWLEVRVAPGNAETVPTQFTVSGEDFLILPVLRPYWCHDKHGNMDFAVPERRFRSLVTFLCSVPPGEVKFNVAANKLRGQMAEVKIGKVTVENRLDLSVAEFFSLVGHALLDFRLKQRQFEISFNAHNARISAELQRHSKNLPVRYLRYVVDNLSLKLGHKGDVTGATLYDRVLDHLFGNTIDSDMSYDPYESRIKYRLLNAECTVPPEPIDLDAILAREEGPLRYFRAAAAYVPDLWNRMRRSREVSGPPTRWGRYPAVMPYFQREDHLVEGPVTERGDLPLQVHWPEIGRADGVEGPYTQTFDPPLAHNTRFFPNLFAPWRAARPPEFMNLAGELNNAGVDLHVPPRVDLLYLPDLYPDDPAGIPLPASRPEPRIVEEEEAHAVDPDQDPSEPSSPDSSDEGHDSDGSSSDSDPDSNDPSPPPSAPNSDHPAPDTPSPPNTPPSPDSPQNPSAPVLVIPPEEDAVDRLRAVPEVRPEGFAPARFVLPECIVAQYRGGHPERLRQVCIHCDMAYFMNRLEDVEFDREDNQLADPIQRRIIPLDRLEDPHLFLEEALLTDEPYQSSVSGETQYSDRSSLHTESEYSSDAASSRDPPPDPIRNLMPGARALPGLALEYWEVRAAAVVDRSTFNPAHPVWPRLASSSSPASDQFYEICPTINHLNLMMDRGEYDLPAPDQGLADLIHYARNRCPDVSFQGPEWTPPYQRIAGRIVPHLNQLLGDAQGRLAEKITNYYGQQRIYGAKRVPFMTLCGVPASGKSSCVREYLTKYREEAGSVLVIVPGRTLQAEWRRKMEGTGVDVVVKTQHDMFAAHQRFATVIVDEAYSFVRVHLGAIMAYAHSTKAKLMLLGDPFQRAETVQQGTPGVDDLLFRRRRFTIKVSNAVPLDAWSVVCRMSHLNPAEYTTRSPITRSILVTSVPRMNDYTAVLADLHLMRLRKDIASQFGDIDSVGSSQGVRVENALLDIFHGRRQENWFLANRGLFMIAFTRHTSSLIVHTSDVDSLRRLFAPAEMHRFVPVDGDRLLRGPGERHRHPFEDDVVMRPLAGFPDLAINAAVPIHLAPCYTEILQSANVVDLSHYPIKEGFPEPLLVPSLLEVQGFVNKHTNFDSFKDHEHAVDFICDLACPTLRTVGEIDLPKRHRDVRAPFEDADKLAEVQKAADRFNDLYNMTLRQFATSKKHATADSVIAKSIRMFERYRECFMRSEWVTHSEGNDFCTDWMHKRAPSFRNRLESNVFGEDRRTVAFQAFLKTQTKAKPEPGYAAQQNYGQQIISNSAEYSAYLSPYVGQAYQRVNESMRRGIVADVGFSDDELSRYMHVSGIADAFSSGRNMQIDVSRQDSSHSAVHVLAFCMLLEYWGIPKDVVDFYFEMRASYKVVSLAPNLYSGSISFNLPSGDPFTLLANIIQMLMTIACRYQDADKVQGLQKGDDATFDTILTRMHPMSVMPEVAAVQFKVDVELAFYHASRFWNGKRLLVDPVRAVLKHLTRLNSDQVPTREYYVSYLDRATDYSSDEMDFLKICVAQRYEAYDEEDIELIVRMAACLRRADFFFTTNSAKIRKGIVVESSTDCARTVAKHVYPGMKPAFYKQFVGRSRDDLIKMFRPSGHKIFTPMDDDSIICAESGIYISPSHVFFVQSL